MLTQLDICSLDRGTKVFCTKYFYQYLIHTTQTTSFSIPTLGHQKCLKHVNTASRSARGIALKYKLFILIQSMPLQNMHESTRNHAWTLYWHSHTSFRHFQISCQSSKKTLLDWEAASLSGSNFQIKKQSRFQIRKQLLDQEALPVLEVASRFTLNPELFACSCHTLLFIGTR